MREKVSQPSLLSWCFSFGIIAPVPECYVTRLVCPLKKSLACVGPAAKPVASTSISSSCCAAVEKPADASRSACPLASLKPRMKSYVPAVEKADAPTLPFSLSPARFHRPVSYDVPALALDNGKQCSLLKSISILLQKQSFLI